MSFLNHNILKWISITTILMLSLPGKTYSQSATFELEYTFEWNLGFEQYPTSIWGGDISNFTPENTPEGKWLRQIGDPDVTAHSLYSEVPIYFGSWEFSIEFDGFVSSNQNRFWFWLQVDGPIDPNGYAVRIGEAGSQKFVRLFRLRGADTPIEILRSEVPMSTSGPIHVQVIRWPDGTWKLGVKNDIHHDKSWTEGFSTVDFDDDFRYIGFETQFTSTRSDRFLVGPIRIRKFPVELSEVTVSSASQLDLRFSEPISQETTGDIEVAISTNSQPESRHIPSQYQHYHRQLTLIFDTPLTGNEYILQLNGLTDNFSGDFISTITKPFILFDNSYRFDVVINEFYHRPTSMSTPAFIELKNRSGKLLNLADWQIGRQQQSALIRNSDNSAIILRPDSLLVLTRNPEYFKDEANVCTLFTSLPTLGRTSDRIWLRNESGTLIDSIAYTNAWVHTDDHSFERVWPDYAGMDPSNWSIPRENYHSAGQTNSVKLEPEITPRIIQARITSGELELTFSNFVEPVDNQFSITVGSLSYETPDWSPWEGNRLNVDARDLLDQLHREPLQVYTVGIGNFGSGKVTDMETELSQPARYGDVVINEIMYQPLQDRYGTHSDQSEYIELKNLRSWSIDLSEVYLRDTADKNESYRSWVPVTPNWTLRGNSYAIIHADTASTWQTTRLHQFFGIPEDGVARVDRSTLGLTTSGRGVYLAGLDGLVIDSVYYDPAWHHPFVYDPRGIALERIHAGSTNGLVSDNWSSSTAPSGGTPGWKNSIAIDSSTAISNEEIVTIYPNPFSPDFDGQNDHTTIGIRIPEPGYQIEVTIFDRFGRRIKAIESGRLAGSMATLIWDGTDSNNRLVQTGMYLVHLQAWHPDLRPITETHPVVLVRKR